MNLAVDFGNTRIKAAVFENDELTSLKVYSTVNSLIQDEFFYEQARNVIVASVTEDHHSLLEKIENKKPLLFNASTPVPLKNLYRSASTLGSDRLAGSIGAFCFYPSRNVLTIDAGTCIKYNFVNAANEYIGGAISPGIPMRLKAMSHFTSRLPEIEPDFGFQELTGTSTNDSMMSGALTGAVCEVEGMIEKYRHLHEDLQVVFTGGDAPYLCKQVKSRFFANPNLVLYGLNKILNYNIEK